MEAPQAGFQISKTVWCFWRNPIFIIQFELSGKELLYLTYANQK
jgi:hypothetical protein